MLRAAVLAILSLCEYNTKHVIKTTERRRSAMPARFTKEMRKTHTIYMPYMLRYHNELLKAAFAFAGYRLDVVPEYERFDKSVYDAVNADYCTCAFSIVGSLLSMVADQSFANERIAFLEPQMGGACRAGNYLELIINSLSRVGRTDIPVLSLNFKGLDKQEGFRINARLVYAGFAAILWGDLLMSLLLQIRPYELNEGETDRLYDKWIKMIGSIIKKGNVAIYGRSLIHKAVSEFASVKKDPSKTGALKRVGICGEIYVKSSPVGNSHLEELLRDNQCEYRIGGFMNYCIFTVFTDMKASAHNGASRAYLFGCRMVIAFLDHLQGRVHRISDTFGFSRDSSFSELRGYVADIISEDYVVGDGWLIAAEAVDSIRQGYDRVLAVHPFGCLVSHVGVRGMIKRVTELYPDAKLFSIEYDRDQSAAMRDSRILLALR